jgi:hypothetical protein
LGGGESTWAAGSGPGRWGERGNASDENSQVGSFGPNEEKARTGEAGAGNSRLLDIYNCMGSFHAWLLGRAGHRPPIIPPPHSIPAIIAQAGRQGITRRELGQVIRLEPRLLDDLLAAFGSVGQIVASREGDRTVFRCPS